MLKLLNKIGKYAPILIAGVLGTFLGKVCYSVDSGDGTHNVPVVIPLNPSESGRNERPDAVYEIPDKDKQPGNEREPTATGTETEDSYNVADSGADLVNGILQISRRGDRFSLILRHDSTSRRRYVYTLENDFDATMQNGVPYVDEKSCWICDPRYAIEGGILFSDDSYPYVGAEASVGVIDRDYRAFIRSEVAPGSPDPARLMIGGRIEF